MGLTVPRREYHNVEATLDHKQLLLRVPSTGEDTWSMINHWFKGSKKIVIFTEETGCTIRISDIRGIPAPQTFSVSVIVSASGSIEVKVTDNVAHANLLRHIRGIDGNDHPSFHLTFH
ncbi:MAG TPA: hypothetical protein VEA18_02125 [Candidatus Kapabacteria bacterium]|nr:hypothetical protein [Candidatus Kapabacteria bacterium]